MTPRPASSSSPSSSRAWAWDALSSLAFFVLALVGGKGMGRVFGPFGALFFFIVAAGLGWRYGRIAWSAFLSRRSR